MDTAIQLELFDLQPYTSENKIIDVQGVTINQKKSEDDFRQLELNLLAEESNLILMPVDKLVA